MNQVIRTAVIGGMIVLAAVPVLVSAQGKAVISFGDSPGVAAGALFNLQVLVDPNGESLDTVRVSLNFPTDKLEVTHWRLGQLFPNVSPAGQIDNEKGLIYQGGFRITGPTSESGVIGTITFKAKQAGEAIITVRNDSLLLGAGEIKNAPLAEISQKVTIQEGVERVAPPEAGLSPEGKVLFRVSSPTHPDQTTWSNVNLVKVQWQIEEAPEGSQFFFDFNQEPNTDPGTALPQEQAALNQLTFTDTPDGVWYFHLKARQPDGIESETVHYRVQIDTAAPGIIYPYLDPVEVAPGQLTQLHFGTIDQLSGISHYTVKAGDQDLGRQNSPYQLRVFKAGEHQVSVVAFDKAGNPSSGNVKLTVVGPEVVKVAGVSAEVWGILAFVLGLIIIYFLTRFFKKFK